MLRFVSQVNNFFSFRESFSRRPSVVFLKARGAFMLRFAFEVNNFFPFRETFCFTVEPVVFLQSRGAFMLPFASGVNHFFAAWRNRRAQCVIPVTREMNSMQTPCPCQLINENLSNLASKSLPAPVFSHSPPPPAVVSARSLPLYRYTPVFTRPLSPPHTPARTFRHMANCA